MPPVARGLEPELDLPPLDGDVRTRGPTLLDWGLFILRAAWRHWTVTLIAFLVAMGGVVAYYWQKTPLFRSETLLLAQRQQALPSMVRPAVPDDSPTRSANELVHRNENLLAILADAGLLPGTPVSSQARLSERAFEESLAENHDDLRHQLVRRLDRALAVKTTDSTLHLIVDWPDPLQAYQLVQAALENFIEARQIQEVTAIDEAISLLKGRLQPLREEVDAAIEEASRGSASTADPSPAGPRPPMQPSPPSEELGRLRATIEGKERAIRDVEDFRRRRLLDLQSQLSERLGVYSESHPLVVTLRREIEGLSRESAQAAALREEERQLRESYSAQLSQKTLAQRARGGGGRPSRVMTSEAIELNVRVRMARLHYQQMAERVTAAELDLDRARAAFKYRYSIVWPAQVPREPVSPNSLKILGVGAIASLLFALMAAAGLDLWSGRIVERWQVERGLGIPILGRLSKE